MVPDGDLDPESFPGQFAGFAQDVVTFLNCLNEFPEFTDEAVNTSMRAFEVDLKVTYLTIHPVGRYINAVLVLGLMSRGVQRYFFRLIFIRQSYRLLSGQFRYPAVQRYIHDLTSEIGEHIDSITVNLSMFTEIGIHSVYPWYFQVYVLF